MARLAIAGAASVRTSSNRLLGLAARRVLARHSLIDFCCHMDGEGFDPAPHLVYLASLARTGRDGDIALAHLRGPRSRKIEPHRAAVPGVVSRSQSAAAHHHGERIARAGATKTTAQPRRSLNPSRGRFKP